MSTPPPVVTFNFDNFAQAYPEFADVNPVRAQSMFSIAEQSLLDNTGGSPVQDANYLTQLFYMLVAHLLTIFKPVPGPSGNNAPVGRMNSAAQGTVNVGFEYNIPEGSAIAAWYNTTQYGAMFWMATARFRSARYYASGSSGIGRAHAYGSQPFNVPGGNVPNGI
jgi:hypothetical protein